MSNLRILSDVNTGEQIFPYTHENAIVDKKGNLSLVKLKDDLSEIYTTDNRNLFNGATFTPNTYMRHDNGDVGTGELYSMFEVDLTAGQTYKLGSVARFVAFKNGDVVIQGVERTNLFTAPSSKAYITVFNENRSDWVLCKSGETLSDIASYGVNAFAGKLKEKLDVNTEMDKYVEEAFVKNNNLLFGVEYKEGYIFNNTLQVNVNYNVFLNVPVLKGVKYIIEPRARLIFTSSLPNSNSFIDVFTDNVDYQTFTPTQDGYLHLTMFGSDNPNEYAFYVEGADNVLPFTRIKLSDMVDMPSADILYGKKWAVCGDSFTNGSNSGKLTEGKYTGRNKVYPYFIGNRTGIEVLSDFFAGGKTLAYPSDGAFSNSLTCPTHKSYYQNIPTDVDYITIYLGINDSHHESGSSGVDGEDVTGAIPLGSITDTDTSTYYGAWNVVLTWLMKNRPFAHIGIIVSNGCDRSAYRDAQIAIARKYGVPFIDMNGDDRTPVMIRSKNPNISADVVQMVTEKQAVDYYGTKIGVKDWHPSDETHEYESHFIENFLRSI